MKIVCKARTMVGGNYENYDYTLDLDIIFSWAKNNEKISLIKEYQMVTGSGLKESKDAVEAAMDTGGADGVVALFKKVTGHEIEPYTKEEFLHLIENAIDNMGNLQYDCMIEATLTLLENVKKRGGLERLAKDRHKFLESI